MRRLLILFTILLLFGGQAMAFNGSGGVTVSQTEAAVAQPRRVIRYITPPPKEEKPFVFRPCAGMKGEIVTARQPPWTVSWVFETGEPSDKQLSFLNEHKANLKMIKVKYPYNPDIRIKGKQVFLGKPVEAYVVRDKDKDEGIYIPALPRLLWKKDGKKEWVSPSEGCTVELSCSP